MNILAIETSFDDTSIAILQDESVISMKTHSQIKEHSKFGGVIPELASRIHSENIFSVIKATLEDANLQLKDINAIAVTTGPGLVNTLQVGVVVAKSLSYALNIPAYGINHMDGHIYSPFIDRNYKEVPDKAIILLVSGGHTLLVKKINNKIKIVGETLDDAVGEAFDKVGKILEIGFPGGPIIDSIYNDPSIEPTKVPIPNLGKYNFSYSGLKSFVLKEKNNVERKSLAKGFQISAIKQLTNKLIKLQNSTKIKDIIIGGGVAANSLLRSEVSKIDARVHIPRSIYAVDNAGMIGYTAYYLIKRNLIKVMKLSEDSAPKKRVGK